MTGPRGAQAPHASLDARRDRFAIDLDVEHERPVMRHRLGERRVELVLAAHARAGRAHRSREELDHPLIAIPEVQGAVTIEGDSVSGLRFSADAPEWSGVRLELLQQQELDRRTVRWTVTSTTGRLPTTGLPVLPSEMSLSSIGFDTASRCEANCEVRVELQHDLQPRAVLRDTPIRPYVRGHEDTPTGAILRDVPF